MKIFGTAFLFLSAFMFTIEAKTTYDASQKISLEIPDAWLSETLPGFLMTAHDGNKQSAVSIRSYTNEEDSFNVSTHIEEMKKNIHDQTNKNGHTISFISQGRLIIGDMPACFIHVRIVVSSAQTASFYMYEIFAGDDIYHIDLTSFFDDKDSELEAIANSFRVAPQPDASGRRTITIPGENLSVDIPRAWISDSVPGMLFSAHNAAGLTEFEFMSFPLQESQSSYVEYVKSKIAEQRKEGGSLLYFTSEGVRTLNAASAYYLEGNDGAANLNKAVYFRAYAVTRNGKVYVMALASIEPGQLYRLETIANSLRFTAVSKNIDIWQNPILTLGIILFCLFFFVIFFLAIRQYLSGQSTGRA
jgi:hypothetical protein